MKSADYSVQIFPGTNEERDDMLGAVCANCACEYGLMGVLVSTCSAHRMLADRRVITGLLFVRHLVSSSRLQSSWVG